MVRDASKGIKKYLKSFGFERVSVKKKDGQYKIVITSSEEKGKAIGALRKMVKEFKEADNFKFYFRGADNGQEV